MDLQFKTFPFEVKTSDTDGSHFTGLVSVFHNIDAYGEIVDDKAFDQDLPDFMENGFIGGLNHDWDNPVGTPQDGTKVTDKGLLLHGNVIDTSHGMDLRKLLKGGVVKKLSIGFRTLGRKLLENADECMAYWEEKGYTPNADDMSRCAMGATVLTRIQLYEGSPVTVPANDLATITAVKVAREAVARSLENQNGSAPEVDTERLKRIREIAARQHAEDILRDAGFSRTERAAFISALKTLLRNAVSDEAEPAPDTKSEEAPEMVADTPVIETSTDTPSAGTAEIDVEAIVTNAPSGEIEAKSDTPQSDGSDDAMNVPFDPVADEIRKAKDKLARSISQRQAQLEANIELSLTRVARR